jgi:hypothetical protein
MNEGLLPFGPGAWAFIALYLCSLLLVGWWGYRARREDSMKDFYLAGGGFGFIVLLLTLYATQYSGNTLFAFTGNEWCTCECHEVGIREGRTHVECKGVVLRAMRLIDDYDNIIPLRNSRMDITWFAFMRSDCIIRDEKRGIMEKLVRAGLRHLCIGVERAEVDVEIGALFWGEAVETAIEDAFGGRNQLDDNHLVAVQMEIDGSNHKIDINNIWRLP